MTTPPQSWVLPDGVEEWLPERAARVERVRRSLLDLFASWGYAQIVPPLLEYLDSLLTGFGSDLDLQTFKVIDQATGRLMGVRADVTSQVARIDAHSLAGDGPARLCYVETVLHARPAGPFESRAPMLVGAELFGAAGPSADAEVIALLAETLACVGARGARIELGHPGIYRALAAAAGLEGDASARVFAALQAKSRPDLEVTLAELDLAPEYARALAALPTLMGEGSVLDAAAVRFADSAPAAVRAIEELRDVARMVERIRPGTPLQFDLCEVSGYAYHSGVVFAAYVESVGQAVARGGRYDGIGAAFGRADRPATGFDADIAQLAALGAPAPAVDCIVAPPWPSDDAQCAALRAAIADLRGRGERVVLHADGVPAPAGRSLRWDGARWVVG